MKMMREGMIDDGGVQDGDDPNDQALDFEEV